MKQAAPEGISYLHHRGLLEKIIAEAPFGLATTDLKGTIVLINRQFAHFLNLDKNQENLIGKKIIQAVEKIPLLFEKTTQCIKSIPVPFYLKSIEIDKKHFAVRGIPVDDHYMMVIHNITKVKELEADVLSAMIEGQDKERKKIAREIHDGIGPLLSAIRFNLEALQLRFNDQLDSKSRDDLIHIINALDETNRDIRALSHNLMPPVLIDFGLVPAINNLCNKIRNSGKMEIEFITNLKRRIDAEYELTIYRIVQELTNNSLKHSGANRLVVQLMDHGAQLLMSVDDNGRGVDLGKKNIYAAGIGLSNVQARVNACRGNCIIESSPDKGFIVQVEIPIQ